MSGSRLAGALQARASVHGELGEVLMAKGRPDHAAGHFDQAHQLYNEAGRAFSAGLALVSQTQAMRAAGGASTGERVATAKAFIEERTGNSLSEGEAELLLGLLMEQEDDAGDSKADEAGGW